MAKFTKRSVRPTVAKSWSFEFLNTARFRRHLIGLFLLGTGCLIAYWMPSRADDAAVFDRQIDEGWMSDRDVLDASDFFRDGGVFENIGSAKIDQQHVIPLINRLREDHQLNVLVVVREPMSAFAVVAEVPADRALRNEIRRTILEVDEQFSGMVLQSWGYRWLSVDFLEDFELEPLRQAQALEVFEAANRRME